MNTVGDYMTPHVQCIQTEDTIDDALDVLVENRLSALPVVDRHSRCVGVLAVARLLDLARKYVDESHDLGEFAKVHHALLIEELQKPGFAERPVRDVMSTPVT